MSNEKNPMEKITDFLYEVTLGFLKKYQADAVNLAKIEAAAFYVKGVQRAREHFLTLVTFVFCLVLAAFGLVCVPIAVIFCLASGFSTKITLLALLGLLVIVVPLAVINRFLSEKTWMKISKSDELVEKVLSR